MSIMATSRSETNTDTSLPYSALEPDETSTRSCTRSKKDVKRWAFCGAVLVVSIVVASVLILTQGHVPGRILHLSDFHYDPIYDPEITGKDHCACNRLESRCAKTFAKKKAPYGRKGCDSPMKLIRSALQAAGSVIPSPDLIVSTGDMVRHHSDVLPEKNRIYNIFEEVFSAIMAVYDVGTTKTAFHLPLEIAQTYGNDDFKENYFFVSKAKHLS